jgi:Xaa-Pro aminopeptidase
MGGGYGGDVGRTVPVSGRFSPEQAAVWDLLVTGYLGGVRAMAPGVTLDEVRAASARAIAAAETDKLQELVAAMTSPTGVNWHIHGVGIESGESPGGDLVEGVVLAYEPMFVSGDDAFYLEDMILITSDGAEVLSKGLPYSANEMAAYLNR